MSESRVLPDRIDETKKYGLISVEPELSFVLFIDDVEA